jgi:CubicO group peptidase (beta-lactamase class C family)
MRGIAKGLFIASVVLGLANEARADFCFDQGLLFIDYLSTVTIQSAGGAVVTYKLGEKPCYWYFGVADTDTNKPTDGKTLFELASVTKVFTTSIMAVHASKNLVDPFGPIIGPDANYVPPGFQPLSKNEWGVTYQQLATFTGGFYWSDPPGHKKINPYTQKDFEDAVKSLDPTDAPDGEGPIPGEKDLPTVNHYSNSSVGFLGQVLMYMDSTKKKTYSFDADGFSAWIADNLTTPLNMPNTAVDPVGPRATGYSLNPNPNPAIYNDRWSPEKPFAWVPWGAAGALRSNIKDMFQFLKANICAYHATDKECAEFPLDVLYGISLAHAPNAYNPAGKLPDATIYVAGLCGSRTVQGWAWQILEPPSPNPHNDTPIIDKGGSHPGFGSYIGFNPAKGYGIVVLLNTGHIGGLVGAGQNMIQHTP